MSGSAKIVIDSAIPYIRGIWDDYADVEYLSCEQINAEMLTDADALVIRTRTKCTKELLCNTSVKAIASATIGYDHINQSEMQELGISTSNAPGCNARAVAQYIGAAIAYYSAVQKVDVNALTVGVIGCGNVGSEVIKILEQSGIHFLKCDPFLAETCAGFVPIETIFSCCDIITLHTPLTRDGKYPTYRMVGEQIISSHTRKGLIINAARGGIIDEEALIKALDEGIFAAAIIDCWENEPNINKKLLDRVLLATPHIAGYSQEGKWNATNMAADYISKKLNIKHNTIEQLPLSETISTTKEGLLNLLLQKYNIKEDDNNLREHADEFERLRKEYNIRRETNYRL